MTGADHAAATLGAAAAVGKPALVMGGGGALSYGRLRAQTDRAAALLAAQGLRFGDHIALLFGNEPQLFPFAWAAQRTGLYYTPVNWHLTPEEAAYIVADCDAAVLVASRAHAGPRPAHRPGRAFGDPAGDRRRAAPPSPVHRRAFPKPGKGSRCSIRRARPDIPKESPARPSAFRSAPRARSTA
ncbi:AMP-binding protein [Actinomadura madurae]|uniref:AMP-binding protein n=1 Tax=Actinomadura madurae TaxID=1993 RepID=UPI0020D23F06|nr:AMP-binding protein [Actinomadura madurae]MCP9977568.1 AMP-binding protein [Actinomadura madurae]